MHNRRCVAARQTGHSLHVQNLGCGELVVCGQSVSSLRSYKCRLFETTSDMSLHAQHLRQFRAHHIRNLLENLHLRPFSPIQGIV